MPSNTPNFNWYLPTIAGDTNVWGSYLNANTTSEDSLVRAIANCNIGNSSPSIGQTGTLWLNNTSNPYPLNIYDGAQWVAIGTLDTSTHTFSANGAGVLINVQVFTSNGTYTPTPGMVNCLVELIGGGGGGGGAPATALNFTTTTAAGGGGGGGYASSFLTKATVGSSQTITIGAGGTGGLGTNPTHYQGGTGGTTSFGSILQATGGSGGTGVSANSGGSGGETGGAGGAGSGGNIVNLNGAPGGFSLFVTSFNVLSGIGGGGLYGAGGGASIAFTASNGNNGQANSGGGGSGAACWDSLSTFNGGAGGSGIVIVKEFG